MPGPGRQPRGMKAQVKNPGELFLRLMKYVLKDYKFHCISVVVLIVVSVLCNVQGTMFMKNLIDEYITPFLLSDNPNFTPLAHAIARVAAFYALGVLATFGYNRLMVNVTQGTLRNLRNDLFSHMEKLPVKYFDTHAHGDIMSVYTNDIDTRLLDKKEVTRARFEITVQDAGYYSETSGYVPVKVDDKWKYLNTDGKYLPGEYDQAGSFYNHKAAVLQGEKWFLIDDTGKTVSDNYEDMKLDLYGSYVQGGVILAKKDGAYHIYDLEENQIGDFSCDDMDICIDGGLIAFKQGDKWGYVDVEGNIAVEPQYAGAKSFSDHLAAICDENGYWGFINSRYEQVIESDYLDAYYFNSDETCMVSASDGTYQIMRFVFE